MMNNAHGHHALSKIRNRDFQVQVTLQLTVGQSVSQSVSRSVTASIPLWDTLSYLWMCKVWPLRC